MGVLGPEGEKVSQGGVGWGCQAGVLGNFSFIILILQTRELRKHPAPQSVAPQA